MPGDLAALSAPLDLPDISKMPFKQAEPLQEEFLEEENQMVGGLDLETTLGMLIKLLTQLKIRSN